MWTEIARLRDRRYGGPAVIRGGAQILIQACELLMVRLIWRGRDALLPGGKQVPIGGLRSYAAIAAIITDMGDVVIDDLLVVDGIDDSRVADIRDGPVILEGIAGPENPTPYPGVRAMLRIAPSLTPAILSRSRTTVACAVR